MRVFITKSFKKKYLSKNNNLDIKYFIKKIKNFNFIILKYPYLKFKFNIYGISYRGVVLKTEKGDYLPIILCLKKDKNCGDDIIWKTFENKIIKLKEDYFIDLENGDFEIY